MNAALNSLITVVVIDVHYTWVLYQNVVISTLAGITSALTFLESSTTFLFMQCFMFIYFAISKPILESSAHHSFTSNDVIIMKYKTILLICDMMNEKFFRYIIPSIKWGLVCISMGGIVIAVKLNHVNTEEGYFILQLGSCFVSSYALLCTIVVATLLSQQYHSSCAWLWKLWLQCNNKLYNRKVWKSLRVLRIQIGGLYHMESQARLRLADIIINGIVNLLLMF